MSRRLCHAGALQSCNPDRVVLKRIVLSGYPVRVHKKKAVVRWMFHNPDDVRWFRPLELWTKSGLRGRIKVRTSTSLYRWRCTCSHVGVSERRRVQWVIISYSYQVSICEVHYVEPGTVSCMLNKMTALWLISPLRCWVGCNMCCIAAGNDWWILTAAAAQEPVGTHGAMKCIFDGTVTQQDAVCVSLYKRVYPKWPEDMQFAWSQ